MAELSQLHEIFLAYTLFIYNSSYSPSLEYCWLASRLGINPKNRTGSVQICLDNQDADKCGPVPNLNFLEIINT